MRRSSAPSMRNNKNIASRPVMVSNLVNSNNSVTNDDNNIFTESTNTNHNEYNNEKIIYNILYTKISTKKHKTWEGDGYLVITGKNATLTDENGTVLEEYHLTNKKFEDIYEGNQFKLGSKEIEIQEKINDNKCFTMKRKYHNKSNDENDSEDIKKKPKSSGGSSALTPKLRIPLLQNLPKRVEAYKDNSDFVLPMPNYKVQWKLTEENQQINQVIVKHALAQYLRPHQWEGVKFLYECLLGYRNPDYFGAILADEMGLGKTFQCLVVCYTLLRQIPFGTKPLVKKVLIIAPTGLTGHWNNEINKWLGSERIFSFLVDSKNEPSEYLRQPHIGFVIISYEMFLKHCSNLEHFNFDILICDEGHRLKNNSTKIAKTLRPFNVKRRILLTATPIQNDLEEFYALCDFVNPGILGDYQDYKRNFESPIVQSQAINALEELKDIGNQKAAEMNRITSDFILRRSQRINKKYLPKKQELIIFVQASELQQDLFNFALDLYETERESISNGAGAFQVITLLKKICNHPSLIRNNSNSNNMFVRHLESKLPAWQEMGSFDSGKLQIVEYLLEEILKKRERIVIVSNYGKTLDMLSGLCDYFEYKYFRLDGSTSISDRNSFVDKFNKPKSDVGIFLLSSKAGGVGLNLSGASNLVLFDNDWNPATDLQAMSRIWRDGQKHDVKIYRLVTAGTIEEKIFQRQVVKTSLTGRVLNQFSSSNSTHFTEEDLQDLFSVQDFNICATHDFLQCNCNGDGKNNLGSNLHEDDSPYYVSLSAEDQSKTFLQVDALKNWEHYKPPISLALLQELHLEKAAENIIFIFRSLSQLPK